MKQYKKIPRGIIYHRIGESFKFLVNSCLMPLDREDVVAEFEKTFAKYNEREYCVAFPFARIAIHSILKDLDFPEGSEIIMPALTIKGIVDAVLDLQLIPVYVDLDPDTLCFQIDDLQKKLGANVKVAIVTQLFGLVPDMTLIVDLLKDKGVFVIEDFSQCLNGRFDGKRIGTFGDVGVFSASSIKTLDTLGGGLAIMNNEGLYTGLKHQQQNLASAGRIFLIRKAWINLVRNLATSNPLFSFVTFPMLKLMSWMNPELALKQTGHRNKDRLVKLPDFWFRKYTSVQAKIGLTLIDRISSSDKARVANAEQIRSACPDNFPLTSAGSMNVYWQLYMHTPDALRVQVHFSKQGIDVATSSLELVSDLQGYPGRADLPNAKHFYNNGIFIPCYPHLTREDIDRIVTAVSNYCEKN